MRVPWTVGLSVTLVRPAKTAESIEVPFGLRTRVGPGNHVLDGSPDGMLIKSRDLSDGGIAHDLVRSLKAISASVYCSVSISEIVQDRNMVTVGSQQVMSMTFSDLHVHFT